MSCSTAHCLLIYPWMEGLFHLSTDSSMNGACCWPQGSTWSSSLPLQAINHLPVDLVPALEFPMGERQFWPYICSSSSRVKKSSGYLATHKPSHKLLYVSPLYRSVGSRFFPGSSVTGRGLCFRGTNQLLVLLLSPVWMQNQICAFNFSLCLQLGSACTSSSIYSCKCNTSCYR